MQVHASVSFAGRNSVAGRDRIRLLEAVAREGSISAAARAVGLSYKAAWDAIDALNDLFGRPLVAARSGGSRGGGAELTNAGMRVVEALTHLEGELSRALNGIEPQLRGGGITMSNLVPGFVLRTSARNALRGVVTRINADAVCAEVFLSVAENTTVRSIVTCRSVDELGLCPGRDALALIKAPLISIVLAREARFPSGTNRIKGALVRKQPGAHDTELIVDIGAGTKLVATMDTPTVKAMRLRNRDPVWAAFDPRHVILAVA